MQIYHGIAEVPPGALSATAVGIGLFDGVHLGHQALLHRVVELAGRRRGRTAVTYTFTPHPSALLRPKQAIKLIEPLSARLMRLAQLGIACCIVEPFNARFAAMSAQAFVEKALVAALGAKDVVVGENFVFGQGRSGNAETLASLGQTLGFDVHAVARVHAGQTPVSSTAVRDAVQAGRVREAYKLLGHPFILEGHVVHGSHRGGSQLGYPTANLHTDNALLPPAGIYTADAHGMFGTLPAVVSVGTNPTFGDIVEQRIEAYLPSYRGPDFYNTPLQLSFLDWLRGEARFDSVEALRKQIAADVAMAMR